MAERTIGIRTARGEFYPILDLDIGGQKRVILSAARADQARVKIDFFLRNTDDPEELRYLSTLTLTHALKPDGVSGDIELIVGTDAEGNINATATDSGTGETRSVSVAAIPAEDGNELPQSESGRERREAAEGLTDSGEDFDFPFPSEEPVLDFGEEESEEQLQARKVHRGINPFMLLGFIVLGLLVIILVAYFILRSTQAPAVPPLEAVRPAEKLMAALMKPVFRVL